MRNDSGRRISEDEGKDEIESMAGEADGHLLPDLDSSRSHPKGLIVVTMDERNESRSAVPSPVASFRFMASPEVVER